MPWQIKDSLLPQDLTKPFCIYKDFPQLAFNFCVGWSWDKLFNADYVRKNGFLFSSTRHANDGPFVFPATFAANVAVIVEPNTPLVHYRVSDSQISSGSGLMKKPLSCLDSAQRIHEKLVELCMPEKLLLSCKCWMMEYVAWTLKSIYGSPRKELIKHVKNDFEKKYNLLNIAKQVENDADFVPAVKLFKKSFQLYRALFSIDAEVEFSDDSSEYQSTKKKSFFTKYIYRKTKDLLQPNKRTITILGFTFSYTRKK